MNAIFKSAFLAMFILIAGCTARAYLKDVDTTKIPYDPALRSDYFRGANISFVVEGDKTFSGRPNTKLSGHIFLLELDLEMIQKESAKKMMSNNLLFGSGNMSDILLISSMKNFRYVIKNVGWVSQVASVSFDLGIIIKKDGRDIYSDNYSVNDYVPGEAEYNVAEELLLGPMGAAHVSKADKLAISAFIGTSKILCEKYRDALISAQRAF